MKFVESPFCFNGKLKTCIVDGRITDELEKNLLDRDIRIMKTPKCEDVYKAISHHPDIQFFNCGRGKIIVCPNLYEEYVDILSDFNIDIIKGEKIISKISHHPDIQFFNCGRGKIIVCPNLYEEYVDILSDFNIDIIKGEKIISKKYPNDIAYNVCVVGKYAIHNLNMQYIILVILMR